MSRKEVEETTLRLFFYALPNPLEGLPSHPALRCGCPVIPRSDAGSREYRQRSSRTIGKLMPHFFIISFLVCSIAPDAVTQSSRTLMRYPEILALVSRTFGKHIPHFFIITFLVCSIAPDAVTQSSRTPMRDSGIPALVSRTFL